MTTEMTLDPELAPSDLEYPEDWHAALATLTQYDGITYTVDGDTAVITSRGHSLTLTYHADAWEVDGIKYRIPGFYEVNENGEHVESKPHHIDTLYAYVLTWVGTLPSIGREITVRRRALGLTQEELARFLCVSQASLAQWEKGAWKPRSLADVLAELDALERHSDRLIQGLVDNVVAANAAVVTATQEMINSYSDSFCDVVVARAAKRLRDNGRDVKIG